METSVTYGVELTGVSKSFGGGVAAVLDITLRVEKGSFVSLLGPSGCGKTTTLRMIAGLETPDTGTIRILGDPVFSSESGIDVAPARRKIGFVFQSYALWPHMSVFDNLAYPLRRAGLAAPAIADKVAATLELLKAPHLGQRYPSELSGGQQQRVALGRAIINAEHEVILFDEPLSNLDAKLRESLRMELRALQEDLGFTAIYVTHDQAEAMSMSDQVVIMREGKIEREGDPQSVFHDPKSRYVAEFFGAHNILPATFRALEQGGPLLDTPLGPLRCIDNGRPPQPGAAVEAALPIEMMELGAERKSPDDFEATVTGVAYYGNYSDVGIDVGGFQLRCRVPGLQRLVRGQKLIGRPTSSALILEY